MNHSTIQKSAATSEDMEKINAFSTRELQSDEVYIFNVTLCNNDIDRDYEKFSVAALEELAPLFIGKTGIADHSMKSADQLSRIFDAYVEKQEGRTTLDGQALIDAIEAGIKKEVSVSCSMGSRVCSVCGKDSKAAPCTHIGGRQYGKQLCYHTLSDARDAYEFSFVAVPAQREAGVTKSFHYKEENGMQEMMKSLHACDKELTLSKEQAGALSDYIEALQEEATLGEAYKKELAAEVIKLLRKQLPGVDAKLLGSVASVMTTKELLGFRQGLKAGLAPEPPKPQIMKESDAEKRQNNYSQFKI